MIKFPLHPLARENNRSGALGINVGEEFIYDLDGRRGRLDEATQDGDAFVVWEDGRYDTIKWNHISPAPSASPEDTCMACGTSFADEVQHATKCTVGEAALIASHQDKFNGKIPKRPLFFTTKEEYAEAMREDSQKFFTSDIAIVGDRLVRNRYGPSQLVA